MAKGGVRSFESLVDQVGDGSAVDGLRIPAEGARRAGGSRAVPIRDLIGNPNNPRDSVGDLQDLASIADFQLQPVIAVTKEAYLRLYPESEISTRWVVILGNRRLAAARKFGRGELDIVVKDELAESKGTLLTAIIAENVDRAGFDVIEEARAVEQLVGEYGNAADAATHLRKSTAWISQRRALLKLAPELQESLRSGDLAIREARSLARVPKAEQVRRWRQSAEKQQPGDEAPEAGSESESRTVRAVTRALRKFDTDPTGLAIALREHLGDTGARTLASSLRKVLK